VTKPLPESRYRELRARAEAHYARQGFVKWADLGWELGVTRQRVLQMIQTAVERGHLTEADVERYRSESSRRAASRTNEKARRQLDKLKLRIALTPENFEWLESTMGGAASGTTRSDLINTAITQYRKHTHA
jgi:hypothetical protein